MNQKLNCILLIDDDEPTNFINAIYIEEAECAHHIQVADSGRKALDYLKSSQEFACDDGRFPCPDLIFLDINMPAMDGWGFLDKYRQLDKERPGKVIIIMLTTSLNPDDKIRAEQIPEISGFESKPLTPELLGKLLKEYFSYQVNDLNSVGEP